MSSSTIVEWLNENNLRAYPFVESINRYATVGAFTLDLYNLVLDATLFYTSIPDSVTLNSITTTGGNLTLTIEGLDPFVVPSYTSATYPYYIRNDNNSLLAIGWSAKSIPTNLTFNLANTYFEPSTAIEIYTNTKGVSSITIASHDLTGNVALIDGYQFSFIPNGHTIDIEVGRNYGHPLPCAAFTDITNDCSLVASFVNGASPLKTGDPIQFVAGNHVKIFEDTDNNRLYIGFDFVATDVPTQILPTALPSV